MKIFLLLSALGLCKGQASKVSTPSTIKRLTAFEQCCKSLSFCIKKTTGNARGSKKLIAMSMKR